jgi:hypothetical protein
MVASTTAELAPGYIVVTDTCGGTMSGYWAIGMARRASRPAIVVTIAMTMERRGRSTKTEDNIGLVPFWKFVSYCIWCRVFI